jgi:hypothetical protein
MRPISAAMREPSNANAGSVRTRADSAFSSANRAA